MDQFNDENEKQELVQEFVQVSDLLRQNRQLKEHVQALQAHANIAHKELGKVALDLLTVETFARALFHIMHNCDKCRPDLETQTKIFRQRLGN